MRGSLPVWELEPWRFDETATPAEVDDRDAHAAELVAAGHQLGPSVHISRLAVLDCTDLKVGARTYVAALAHLSGNISLGEDCSVNTGTAVRGDVHVGRAVRIGAYTAVLGFDHGFADLDSDIYRQPLTSRGIEIGDDVWIGAHVIVRDGVRIGSHAVVGAGSIVTRDVPDWAVVVGNPARMVRDRRRNAFSASNSLVPALGERIRAAIPKILDRSFVDGWYRDHPGAARTVRAHTEAVELADLVDGRAPAHLTRAEHTHRLRDLQAADTGLVDELDEPGAPHVNGLPDHVRSYHVLAVGYALHLLGRQFLTPVHAITSMSAAGLVTELDQLAWDSNAWGAGALTDAVGTALTWAHLADPRSVTGSIEAVIGWTLTRQDPGSGLWGTTANGLLEPVNGAFRLVRGTLAQWGVPGARLQELTDSVLRRSLELNGQSTACDALDVAYLLWWAARTIPGYRREERSAVARSILSGAAAAWQPNLGWGFQPGDAPSLRGTHLWSSTVWYAADLLGESAKLGYRPRGVHRPDPLLGRGLVLQR